MLSPGVVTVVTSEQIVHRFCQAAYTCLIGKTIFKIRSIGNYLRTVFRHQKLSLICCRFCRSCCNFCRITDFINNTYIIHSLHRYMCRIIRKRHKTARNRSCFICMNVRFTCNYGSYTTTMGTHDSKTFQLSL